MQMNKNNWSLYEVFIRSKQGLSHRHVGSLRAPDDEIAEVELWAFTYIVWKASLQSCECTAPAWTRIRMGETIIDSGGFNSKSSA